jgi:hypothetical protein
MPASSAVKEAFHVLFREWDSETWHFGPVLEVKIDK